MIRMLMKEHKEVVSEAAVVLVEIEVEEVIVVVTVGVDIIVTSKKIEFIEIRNGHETEMRMDQIIIIARQKFLEEELVVVEKDEVIKEAVVAEANHSINLKTKNKKYMKVLGITKKIFEIVMMMKKNVKILYLLLNRCMKNQSRRIKKENKVNKIKNNKIRIKIVVIVKMIHTENQQEVETIMMIMMTSMMKVIKDMIVTKSNLFSQNGKEQLEVVMEMQEEQIKVVGLITVTR